MKKLATLLITAVVALTACLGLTACNKGTGVIDVTTKTITVGYTDYAPMNYTEKGVLKGFDTELAVTVFTALGYDVKFKLIDWNNKYMELDGGTIDCIWNGFTANSADSDGVLRSEKVDFSTYYMQNAQCIVRKSSTAELTAWAGFAGKSVAYETSSAADSLIAGELEAIEVNKKGKTSQMDAIKDVNSGVTDYAVVDILLAQSLAGQGDYADLVINTGIEIGAEYYAIGFKKGSELTAKVNVILEALGKVGYTTELATKYGLENSLLIKG
jgi:polar amino acid transport system substrate-binding protein